MALSEEWQAVFSKKIRRRDHSICERGEAALYRRKFFQRMG
jgi:hypothetical protein